MREGCKQNYVQQAYRPVRGQRLKSVRTGTRSQSLVTNDIARFMLLLHGSGIRAVHKFVLMVGCIFEGCSVSAVGVSY